jgi:glycolate oxidase FAD binding subunit
MSVNAPPAQFSVDGVTPSSVIEPSSIEELATALRDADNRGAAVIPWGTGRHMSLGNVPARYDIALRTTKLDRMIEYEPADMTITVEAGITMGRLQSLLAEHGQFLPIDAPTDATVGGVLSAGVSGPSRHAYGLPRDWLIGCRIALADGTIVKGGGRVVKNVAGYDMPKLVIGSLGTLGVTVEATFKLAPLPPAQETLVVRCESLEEATRLAFAVDERSLALRAVAIRQAQGPITAAFWLSGTSAAVERTRREVESLCSGKTASLVDSEPVWWANVEATFTSPPASDMTVTVRASLLPSDIAAFCAEIAPRPVDLIAYPTTGVVLAQLDASEDIVAFVNDTRRCVSAQGGSLVVTTAPLEVKRRIDVWGEVEGLALMRSLKQQFDPKSTLNPGRYVGGI